MNQLLLLAVRSGYPGQWADISRDSDGRGLAATLLTSAGASLRVVAVYAPVGASSPGFSNSPLLQAEEALNHFVERQIRASANNDTTLIVGGDLNSFTSKALDTWGGTYVDRPACLAALLLRQGLVDTFRARHPTLQAFTYYARSGAASRLDAVWWLPSPSHEVLVLNAATI